VGLDFDETLEEEKGVKKRKKVSGTVFGAPMESHKSDFFVSMHVH
jgi:hypothetical protein